MQALRLVPGRVYVFGPSSSRMLSSSGIRLALSRCSQQRRYASPTPPTPPPPKGAPAREELKRQAKETAQRSGNKNPTLPEKLVIYHAGTGPTTFLAMVKITTLLVGAFFCFIVVPSYVKAEQSGMEIAKVAACGIAPAAFVLYTTAPFVTHVYIHLPATARASRAALERFVRALPPSTRLTVTTMSAIGKPRYSALQAAELVPARRRLGVANYVRDPAAEDAARRWYNFRAVGQFHIREGSGRKARYQRKSLVEHWIWDAIKEKLARRAEAASF